MFSWHPRHIAETLVALAIMIGSACSGGDGRTTTERGPDQPVEGPITSEERGYEASLPSVPGADRLCIYSTHDCGIENGPVPEYPKLTELGEATCDTSFVVGEDGFADDISVECDDPRFNETTREALSHVQYKVTGSCGRACPEIGRRFEYPFEYRLNE